MAKTILMRLPGLAHYQLGDIDDWASLIFPRVFCGSELFTAGQLMGWEKRGDRPLCGYISVIDPKFGSRAKHKLAAGHKKSLEKTLPGEIPDETPLDTAIRELEGETGIKALPEAFRYVNKWLGARGNHWKCLFTADITEGDRDWMNNHHKENEGEMPKFFTVDEFYSIVREGKFMAEHYQKLEEFGLILPLGRDRHNTKATA